MKILLITIALISTLFGFDWPNNYKEALETAKKENKDVYMLLTSEDCGWCRKFERDTLDDDDVLDKLKEKYVLVSMMKEWDYIPKQFQTKRVPRHYFLTSEGKVIYTLLGYWDDEDFLSFLGEIDKEKIKLGL
ncbi:thioredoxin family protein [Sulfurimonas sp.]